MLILNCMQFYLTTTYSLLLAAALVAAGCTSSDSGDDASQDEPTAESTTTTTTAATTTTTPGVATLSIGLPFGIAQLAALGGADTASELEGLAEVNTEPITNPDALRTGFANGELNAAIMPTNIAANLFSRGVDVRIAGIVDSQLLHVLGPAGTTWEDLEGQVVHLPFQGDVADLLFKSLLEANEVDIESITMQYGTALPDLVGAAASGTASYLVLPEHFATLAVAQASVGGQDLMPVIDLQDEWAAQSGGQRIPQVALVVSGALAQDHPDVVAQLGALAAANLDRTTSDPDAAASLSEATGLPAPAVQMVLDRLKLDYRTTSEAKSDLDLFFTDLLALSPDSIGGSLPTDDFFIE